MKVLVIVDMQNDFIDGVLGTPEAQAIVPKVVDKIKEYEGTDTLLLFIKETPFFAFKIRESANRRLSLHFKKNIL